MIIDNLSCPHCFSFQVSTMDMPGACECLDCGFMSDSDNFDHADIPLDWNDDYQYQYQTTPYRADDLNPDDLAPDGEDCPY